MSSTPRATDPIAMVESLDPAAIRRQLIELHDRQQALRVLLKAATALGKDSSRRGRKEAAHAS